MLFATTGVDLEIIILSEVSQTEKDKAPCQPSWATYCPLHEPYPVFMYTAVSPSQIHYRKRTRL